MCYETALTKNKKQISSKFKKDFAIELEFEPYFHKTGFTHPNLQIIKMDEPNLIYPASWGLVPEWGIDDISAFRKKYNTLNAKQETLLTSGTYKKSAREQRCLILSDGFFEPHKVGEVSIPNFCYIPTKDYDDGKNLFAFAGVFSVIEESTSSYTCSIITTAANSFFEKVHNVKKRMPLVLDEGLYDEWFNTDLNDSNINELMQNGFTSKDFDAYAVSRDLYKRNSNTNTFKILERDNQENNDLFS